MAAHGAGTDVRSSYQSARIDILISLATHRHMFASLGLPSMSSKKAAKLRVLDTVGPHIYTI